MSGPLEGIKVVELGVWVAGPSCAAILGEWGADVIKIEPPEGDPFRGLFASLADLPINPPFELDNRGKRSVAINLAHADGLAVALRLIDDADVFVSNMRPRVLEKYGLDYESAAARNPRLIYCQVTGYGPEGEESNRAAYDVGAFWSRAGIAASLVPTGTDLPQQRGGMGDHMTGANAAGAISAALYNREKTGKGQRVAVSLVRIGAYMMGWDVNSALTFGLAGDPTDRYHSVNPIINCYRAQDRWFWLLLLQADRHWPDLMRAIESPAIASDQRFASIASRREHAEALTRELDTVFATKTLDEWSAIFDRENVWFAPVNTLAEMIADPVVAAAGAFVDVDMGGVTMKQVATPVDFYGTPGEVGAKAPELGQDTEMVLVELGYDWERIAELKEAGAIL